MVNWSPKHPDQQKSLEDYIASLKREESRRDEAQRVIKGLWREKFSQLFGRFAPSPEPFFKPCEDEGVYTSLHQFFDINLNAKEADDIHGDLIQSANGAFIVAVKILGLNGYHSKKLIDLLADITERASRNAFAHQSIKIMEKVLDREINKRVRDSIIEVCNEDKDAASMVYKFACHCRNAKNEIEGAAFDRNKIHHLIVILFFGSNQSVEELFRELKIKSDEQLSKPSWLFG